MTVRAASSGRSDKASSDSSEDEATDDGGLDGDDTGQDERGLGVHDDRGEDDHKDGDLHRMHLGEVLETTSQRCEYLRRTNPSVLYLIFFSHGLESNPCHKGHKAFLVKV